MKRVVIVGGGPAGLMAAHVLATAHEELEVHIYDANKAIGRKFLVAGNGGFNLSNTLELDKFLLKYNHPFVQHAVTAFDHIATTAFLKRIGIPTYIGSSGKLFPEKGIKPIQVLSNWIDTLQERNVQIHVNHRLVDIDKTHVSFLVNGEIQKVSFDFIVYGLGGASWKKTGSSGNWSTLLQQLGIRCIPFQASNVGVEIQNWPTGIGGEILKNVQIQIGSTSEFGEIDLTDYGLEGTPVYALSHAVRTGHACASLNLKPALTAEQLQTRFKNFNGNKTAFLKDLKINKAGVLLFKQFVSKEHFVDDQQFLKHIHNLRLPIKHMRPLDEAISTVGGVDMREVHADFELKQFSNQYCVGEMLDWDAPTGGYLLQACFSMGYVAAHSILNKCK